MKVLYKYAFGMLIFFSLGVVACSEDDEVQKVQFPQVPQNEPISLDVNKVDILVDGSSSIKVSGGAGDYKVFSLNPEIATVKFENQQIVVTGVKLGITAIMVSDAANQYKSIDIRTYVDKIELEKSSVQFNIKLGYSAQEEIAITKGNGKYKCVTSSDVVDAIVSENTLIIVARKQGDAELTITDDYGISVVLPVSVTTSTVPYTESELIEIIENGSIRYVFNGSQNSSWVTYVNTTEGDFNVRGYKYYTYMALSLYYAGDHSVGKKTGSMISYKNTWGDGTMFDRHPVDFEIIKNDGNKIWAIYSFVENDKLNYGHFCANL